MTKKIKVKNGNMSIEVDETSKTIFTDILDSLPGDTIKILQQTTEDIYKDAYAVWPVQKPITTQNLTEEGKVRTTARNINKQDKAAYSLKRAFAASYKMQKLGILQIPEFSIKSKGSKDKLYTGFVFSGDSIEAVVGNSAPYAWAIKVGVDTDLPYSRGTRVANELIWKPMRNSTNRVVTSLSKELTQSAKG